MVAVAHETLTTMDVLCK